MVNNTCSEWSEVFSGIPQGSVLGPILFIAFINDFVNGIQSKIKIFADDTKIYNSVNNYIILQDDVLALSKWSDQWLLPFKCKVLHYGKHNTNHEYQMSNIAIPMCRRLTCIL